MRAIHECHEEEFSLAPSWFWRRPKGWRALLMYFRGPDGVPFFIMPFFTLFGIWKFSRRPRRLCDMDPALVVGGRILKTSCYLGSYGMGGPGFVGLKVRGSGGRSLWVVVTVWGASGWLTIDGKPCREGYFDEECREMQNRMGSSLPSLSALKGAFIDEIEIDSQQFSAKISAGGSVYQLSLLADSSFLPEYRGSKEPKIMEEGEDIRNAIIVTRRGHLWL